MTGGKRTQDVSQNNSQLDTYMDQWGGAGVIVSLFTSEVHDLHDPLTHSSYTKRLSLFFFFVFKLQDLLCSV